MASPHVVVEELIAFAPRAAESLAETIAAVLASRGRCAIALSGGRTPGPVYTALATGYSSSRIDWNHVEVYFADERAVPRDHADSNFRMAK